MMTEDTMRLFRDQMDAWMKLMNPANVPQNVADMQRAWENVFRQQMELWQRSSEDAQTQMQQMLRPFQQQVEAMQTATQSMQRFAEWFTSEADHTFKTMRDYYTTLAEVEERLAKLHHMTADQIERMQGALPTGHEEQSSRKR
jgi:hypothetical protein